MKNSRMYVSMLLILLLLLSGCAKEQKQNINTDQESAATLSGDHSIDVNQASDYDNGRKVKIRLKKYDEAAVDRYPQKLHKIYSSDMQGYTVLEIAIHNQSKMFFVSKLNRKSLNMYYPEEVEVYTKSSEMIDTESDKVKDLAEGIYPGDLKSDHDIWVYADAISAWEMKNMKYDNRLAKKIYNNNTWGYSASETIEKKSGTCNEYANLCIALLREKGIPAKYAMGFWSLDNSINYHAWTEIYIPEFGWIPFDSMQKENNPSMEDNTIRLFSGKDMKDIGYPLREIAVDSIEETSW